jgi:hypothetical protein
VFHRQLGRDLEQITAAALQLLATKCNLSAHQGVYQADIGSDIACVGFVPGTDVADGGCPAVASAICAFLSE